MSEERLTRSETADQEHLRPWDDWAIEEEEMKSKARRLRAKPSPEPNRVAAGRGEDKGAVRLEERHLMAEAVE